MIGWRMAFVAGSSEAGASVCRRQGQLRFGQFMAIPASSGGGAGGTLKSLTASARRSAGACKKLVAALGKVGFRARMPQGATSVRAGPAQLPGNARIAATPRRSRIPDRGAVGLLCPLGRQGPIYAFRRPIWLGMRQPRTRSCARPPTASGASSYGFDRCLGRATILAKNTIIRCRRI